MKDVDYVDRDGEQVTVIGYATHILHLYFLKFRYQCMNHSRDPEYGNAMGILNTTRMAGKGN